MAAPRRLRLLSIGHSYAVAVNRRLVHEMARAGGDRWEVTAVAPGFFHGGNDLRPVAFEAIENEPVRVEVVPTRLSRRVHVFTYERKLKHILREGWDVVHAWEEPYIFAGTQIARWTPREAKLVYRTAQSWNKKYPPPFNWLEAANMRRAAGWICSGSLVAQVLGSREMYKRRPMRVIPLGVDLDAFKADRASAEPVFRQLQWEKNGPAVVGYLGRFTEAKGLPLLMNVLSKLNTPWRALFVGAGPLEAQLRGWAAPFGDRVRLCTDVRHADVPAYLNAMDMMVAPSQTTPQWREQFGRMLIEAFACGVPVIGSDSGEIPHVIADAGVVVGERDEAGWRAAIESLLTDTARRCDLAQRGLARAPQFAWSNIARQYLDFFERLMDGRESGGK
jgi:glycosyltransferase involved in cell wall biosynthesis